MKNDTTSTKQSDSANQEAGGGWMRRLVRGWRARKRARTIARIRAHFAFFGYDISGLSDDEIEERSHIIAQTAATCGISAKEAAVGIQNISRAMSRHDSSANDEMRDRHLEQAPPEKGNDL